MTIKKHEKRRVRMEMSRTGTNYTTSLANLRRRERAVITLVDLVHKDKSSEERRQMADRLEAPGVLERVESSMAAAFVEAFADDLESDGVGNEPRKIATAPSLEEAREFLKRLDRDAVSTDIGFPERNGLGGSLADGFAMIERLDEGVVAFAYNAATRAALLGSDVNVEVHADKDVLWGAVAFVRSDLCDGEILLLGTARTTVRVDYGPHVDEFRSVGK